MDHSIKQYADSLYQKTLLESADVVGREKTQYLLKRSSRQNSSQLFSGVDYQVLVRIYAEHIDRVVSARLDSYQKVFKEVNITPTEDELQEILGAFKATWELQIKHSHQALSTFLASRSVPGGLDLSAGLRSKSAQGHDRVLQEWKIWRDQVRLQRSIPSSEARHNDVQQIKPASVDQDEERGFEQMAIEEARKSIPEDERDHPKVGAVIVKDGRVVSKAHRGENPKSHAEYIALEEKLSDDLVAGSTVYTTLEPCTTRNHPKIPCAQRLVERKVARVVIGMLDPNPEIRGLGEQLLSEAGIEVQLFPRDLRAQVEEMNREFIRAQKQRVKKSVEATAPAKDPKIEAILDFKGKVVTVLSRPKWGHSYLEGYWANGTMVVDCTGLWVTLKDPNSKDPQSFSLTKVTVGFDNSKNRLQLDIER